MDTITTAIVAALSSGAVSGASKVGEQVVAGAYAKLKGLLREKFGVKSKVVRAVSELEANPKSAARKEVVKEEVASARADQDQELLQVAQSLLTSIKALPNGNQIIQTAIGDQNIQIAGDSNTVNVGASRSKK